MTFELKEQQLGVSISGELSRLVAKAALLGLVEKMKPNQARFILDLAGLSACDSAGVSVILRLNCLLQKKGEQLLISHPPVFFMDLVRVSGLDSVLTWA